MIHTFETCCWIPPRVYDYLNQNLPNLTQVSRYVQRTNYFSSKGIMQVELHIFEFEKYGITMCQYYLILRCNLSIIMGGSRTLLLDDEYSPDELLAGLQKRLYEINQFRYVQLDKLTTSIFQANRIDLAQDILTDNPELLVWLCNMSFPFNYRNMKRKVIHKPPEQLYHESCCFCNGSRGINLYYKKSAMVNMGHEIAPEERERIERLVRFEVQVEKRGIYNMKLPTRRLLNPFLDHKFCSEYVKNVAYSIFGTAPYLSREKALEAIQSGQHKPYDRAVMESIIDMIPRYGGLYELEKAIDDESVNTPLQYGNLRTFKTKWLSKFKTIGIQPVAIPDDFSIDKFPSITTLLLNLIGGHNNDDYEENQH